MAIIALTAPPCHADALDVVNVVAGVSSKYDDNLFRLPSGQDTSALTGRTERGDRVMAVDRDRDRLTSQEGTRSERHRAGRAD